MIKHKTPKQTSQSGQALVEYTLIAALVILAFAFVIAATAPAIGNIFSNTVVNLLDAETPIENIPDQNAFWLTVTWVYQNTPAEVPLPTRTKAPPTRTPTDGPSPTYVPTNTPEDPTATWTPPPTNTPQDIQFDYPWHDSADAPVNWRLDETTYLGSNGWFGQYFGNMTLSGSPDYEKWNADLDESKAYILNWRWGNSTPFAGWKYEEFSVIWRRQIYLTEQTTLNFDVPIKDDGVRIWILGGDYGGNPDVENGGPGDCSSLGVTSGGSATGSNNTYADSYFGYDPGSGGTPPTECLLYDSWKNQNSSKYGIERTVPGGIYTIQVDYYENSGGANIEVDISSASNPKNPDDAKINDSGGVVAGNPDCQWNRVGGGDSRTDDTNTRDYMWEDYANGDISDYNRCYLELRGFVEIPAGATNPSLTFWDVWDLQSPNLSGYIEVAEYTPKPGGGLDRDAVNWQKIPVHTGDTYNYNWTYQTIPLSNVLGNVAGKKVTVRFVIEARNVTGRRQWFVDDISIDNVQRQTFNFASPLFHMDFDDQADNFITSGRWQLTTKNVRGGDGMSWEDSYSEGDDPAPADWPYTRYEDFDGPRVNNADNENMRMHTIEFNGFIDPDDVAGAVDYQGDKGEPMISFWHGYHLGYNTGLELQYTTDDYSMGDAANWVTVPGGSLVPRDWDGAVRSETSLQFIEIGLGDVISAIGPGTKFRLRFAMTIQDSHSNQDGWWIDDIALERKGAPKFTDYPYYDPVEVEHDDWLKGGSWSRELGGVFDPDEGHAYTDSPGGNYSPGMETSLELRYPFDMRLDTEENPRSPNCTLAEGCETPLTVVPVDNEPILTFWHWRKLSGGEDFYVEWKRVEDTTWNTLWAYVDKMTTWKSYTSSRTQDSIAWERVEVDLQPVIDALNATDDPANFTDDDIVFRFRFKSDTGSTDDGLYIDDIRFDNRQERVFYLWPSSETRYDQNGDTIVDENGTAITGSITNGIGLLHGIDTGGGTLANWHIGGEWGIIDFEQREGLYAFHDSVGDQVEAPPYNTTTLTNLKDNTFNVLEMAQIIDLRGVDSTEMPILYFWSRYYIKSSDTIKVQISYDMGGPPPIGDPRPCNNGLDQCYEHLYGWSEWETVWEQTPNRRTYTWQREQVSLTAYAKQSDGQEGRRIRIRFVTDGLDRSSDNQDSWYIDEISVQFYNPFIYSLPFFDGARNLQNWVTEGKWGLSPEFFRGSGGGPASLGTSTWRVGYWDVESDCRSATNYNTCVGNFLDARPDFSTADRPASAPGLQLDINNDYGYDGPYSGWERDWFAGRWELTTPVVDGFSVSPGTYTFITISDDGVRFKYDTVPPGNLPAPDPDDPPPDSEWNIIHNWTDHGRTVDMGTAKLAVGFQYKFTLEYYEKSSKAVIIMTTGANNFSFTDSPKQGSGPAFPEVAAVPRGNSSLILDGVLDLSTATSPILQYYTYYELGGSAVVEVTVDGGFTWTQRGLRGAVPASVFTSDWIGSYYNDDPTTSPREWLDYEEGNPGGGNSPDFTRNDGDLIDFSWGNGSPKSGWETDYFSVRWERTISLSEQMQITFDVIASDGFRLWLDYSEGCEGATLTGTDVIYSGEPKTFDDQVFSDPSTNCILIDDWENSSWNSKTVTRTIPAGTHTLQLDYYDNTGAAFITMEMATGDLGDFDDPTYGYFWMPNQGDWRLKQHDLREYAGHPGLGLRFRLDRLNTDQTDRIDQTAGGTPDAVNWLVSWWITDITVIDP